MEVGGLFCLDEAIHISINYHYLLPYYSRFKMCYCFGSHRLYKQSLLGDSTTEMVTLVVTSTVIMIRIQKQTQSL